MVLAIYPLLLTKDTKIWEKLSFVYIDRFIPTLTKRGFYDDFFIFDEEPIEELDPILFSNYFHYHWIMDL